jgi:RNA polymerase sigma-70 factor (ECF subfamily)
VVEVPAAEVDEQPVAADDEAFETWVCPHLQAMANLAARLVGVAERDDIVQESLARAWRKWRTYRPERGTPRTWLLAIVADQARRSGRRRTGELAPDELTMPPGADVDLERAVASLPRRQRLAVHLHYFVDLPVADCARVMGCAPGTVKRALFDARQRLRRDLGES